MPEPTSPVPPRPRRSPRPSDREDLGRPAFSGPWLFVLLFLGIATIWMVQNSGLNGGSNVSYTYLWKQVLDKNVEQAEFSGEIVKGTWKKPPLDPEKKSGNLAPNFRCVLADAGSEDLFKLMRENGVMLTAVPQTPSFGAQLLLWMLGPLLLLGFMYYMMRRNADPTGAGMLGNFVRSPAKRIKSDEHTTTFDDVAAMEHAKQDLQEIVEFLKTPAKFQRLGAQIPKGVLLMGPPGTGKTLLARATAGEAGVPFFAINGSEFIQMFVGVGASRVRDLFRQAKEAAPCILFIDEIDAVGRIRGAGLGGGHDEREQTLNQILGEMDGFTATEAVIVIAATNRPDVLDPALLRPGRFDRHVTVDRPSRTGREAILKVHCRKVPLGPDVNLSKIASGTIGFSGAELKNLVNEAALGAARAGRDSVIAIDFDAARDKILMGPERTEVLTLHERRMTAYHEAGHALLAWLLADVDPVHKVTIIPRGRALGVTQLLPNEDRYNIGERRLHSQLAFMLGGRAAEKLVFNEFSAGAEDDLNRATQIARRMVTRWGMSEKIGPVAFRDSEEHPFLGKEMSEPRQFSEQTASVIDGEVQRILHDADQTARRMLNEQREKLDKITDALLEHESVDDEKMTELIGPPVTREA